MEEVRALRQNHPRLNKDKLLINKETSNVSPPKIKPR